MEMCNELSAVFACVAGDLQMYRSPDTDAHQDVLELYGLTRGEERCACVEYVCTDYARAHEPDAWDLQLDEQREPAWWGEQRDAVLAQMDRLREGLTIREDRLIIVGGGPYILAPGVSVSRMVRARILTMCERARGGNDSTLTGGNDSTLTGGAYSKLTGGDDSTLTGGVYSKLTGGDRSKLTGGIRSTLTGGDRSTLTGGDHSTLTGGDRSKLTGGIRSKLTSGDDSTLTGGIRSTLTGGHYSKLTGGDDSTLTGGVWSKLTGGIRSTLTGGHYSALRTDHGDHMHEARVGSDGILPGHAYTVREETWVLA